MGAEAVAAPMKSAVASKRALDVALNDRPLAVLWVIRMLHPRRSYLFPDSYRERRGLSKACGHCG
jgi:hypothetical protein